MTEFFVRKTAATKLADGRIHTLVRGIREVPDILANSAQAHKLGIIPISEMTDQERADFGLPLQLDVDPSKEVTHEGDQVKSSSEKSAA